VRLVFQKLSDQLILQQRGRNSVAVQRLSIKSNFVICPLCAQEVQRLVELPITCGVESILRRASLRDLLPKIIFNLQRQVDSESSVYLVILL